MTDPSWTFCPSINNCRRWHLLLVLLLGYLTAECQSMKECIDPIRSTVVEAQEQQCDVFASVPESICHAPTKKNSENENDIDDGCSDHPGGQGSNVCAFVVEAFFAEWKMLDAALMVSGNCNDNIHSGRFTPGDAMRVLPDNHEVMGVTIRGSDLVAALEHGLVSYYVHGQTDAYPHTAGLKYQLDLLQPPGQRIQKPKILKFGCGWKPLDPNDHYMVLTNAAIARDGAQGYTMISDRAIRRMPTGNTEAQSLWLFASSVCVLEDNWHQMRLHHDPAEIPLEVVEEQGEAAPKRTVTSTV